MRLLLLTLGGIGKLPRNFLIRTEFTFDCQLFVTGFNNNNKVSCIVESDAFSLRRLCSPFLGG